MIDSHCHLTDDAFAADLPAVLERAKGVGVDRMVTISNVLDEGEACIALAEKHAQIFCTVGMHPHHAKDWTAESPEMLRRLIDSSAKVRGVGECGLDYHYDHSPRDVQARVFREQLAIATEKKLPVVVHCREAVADVWRIVDEMKPDSLVLHCCSEKLEDVQPFLDRGYFLSFTGIATYANTDEIRRTIRMAPIAQMMIETDAPYLTPVPFRGKRNEPMHVVEVVRVITHEKGLPFEEASQILTDNTVAFFGLPL